MRADSLHLVMSLVNRLNIEFKIMNNFQLGLVLYALYPFNCNGTLFHEPRERNNGVVVCFSTMDSSRMSLHSK